MFPSSDKGADFEMLTVECPWCDGPMALDDGAPASGTCDACLVRVELAPDPVAETAALAA
jgi:hypothetical protein